MKYSEYLQTEALQKRVLRRRIAKKKTLFDLIVALVFILLAVVLYFVMKYVPEWVKSEGWFIAIVTTVTFCCLGAACVLELVNFRGRNLQYDSIDPTLGIGILLFVREFPFDMKHFIKENELLLPVAYGIAEDEVASISFGEVTSIDLTPFGGVAVEGAVGVASLPVLDFLSRADIYSLSLRTVCLVPTASDGMQTVEGDLVYLVKKGRWTLLGRTFRRDYRRIFKAAQKLSPEVVL